MAQTPAARPLDMLAIDRLMEEQDGLVNRRQALDLGASPSDLRRLVRQRRWARVHDGVYVDHTGPLTGATTTPGPSTWPWRARAPWTHRTGWSHPRGTPHGLPWAHRQVRSSARGRIYRDVVYEGQGTVVELDGRLDHTRVRDRDRDRTGTSMPRSPSC